MNVRTATIKKTYRAEVGAYENKKTKFKQNVFVALDFAALALSIFIAGLFSANLTFEPVRDIYFYGFIVTYMLLALMISKLSGLYRFKMNTSSAQRLPKIIIAVGMALFIPISIAIIAGGDINLLRYMVLLWPVSIVVIFLLRVSANIFIGWQRQRGVGLQNVLIMGAGEVGNDIAKKLKKNPHLGLKPVGFVDSDPISLTDTKQELNILGKEDDLDALIKKYSVDQVIVSFLPKTHHVSLKTIRENGNNGVTFNVVPRLFEAVSGFDSIDAIQSIPIMTLRGAKKSMLAQVAKRTIDILGSSFILMFFSPMLLLISILIKLDNRGPILFKQIRCGKGGEHFTVLKFRSMRVDAEAKQKELIKKNEADGLIFKMKNDPRITKIGVILRKFSLDEFPQFFNVLKGEMSLVGPRPPIPAEVSDYNEWHMQRLSVRPGITGLWQISGRSDLSFEEMVRLDVQYANNWSIWLDIVLLLRTIPAVILQRGAY